MKNALPCGIFLFRFSGRFAACAAAVAASALLAVRAGSAETDWTRIYAAANPAISADGGSVFFVWAGENWTAPATGGTAKVSASFHPPFPDGAFRKIMGEAMAHDVSVSRDGGRALFRFRGDNFFRARFGTESSRSGEIWLYDSAGKSFSRLSKGGGDSRMPVWLGDGAAAYIKANSKGTRDIVRVDIATGAERILVQGGEYPVTALSASADGRRLLFRRGVDLWIADAEGGAVRERMLVFHPETSWKRPARVRRRFFDPVSWGKKKNGKVWNCDGDGSVAVTPDGKDAIFTTGGDLWAVEPGNGTNAPVLLRGRAESHERDIALSPDGASIYYVRDFGDRSEIWRMRRKDSSKPWHKAGAVHEERLVSGRDFYQRLKLSPDGSILSWTEFEGRLMAMPASGERKLCELTPPGTYWSCEYAWSPDGRYIAIAAGDRDRNVDVWVVDVRAGMEGRRSAVNVSDHFGWDGEPAWSADSGTLVFRGEWGECGKTLFKVDMRRRLSTGCASAVKRDDEKKILETLVKGKKRLLPYFKAVVDTPLDDYFELGFKIAVSRLYSRFLGGRHRLVDMKRMLRWKDAARHAATWNEFHWILNMAMGEIDASHIEFRKTDVSKKEWSVANPVPRGRRNRRKIASVQGNRTKVEKATQGRWSYIHFDSMDAEGFDNFRNDLFRHGRGREGIILDMRGNTGGNRADLAASCLMMPRHGWTDWSRGRHGYIHDHMRRVQFPGKIVLVTDEIVGSNAEMFVHAMKTFSRAVVVGRATAGEVLATENMPLLDLGEFRIPNGIWFTEEGVPMENRGAQPDVPVDDTPAEWARGVDSQLEKAIATAKDFPAANR